MLAGKRAMGIDLIADRRKQKQAAIKAVNVTTLGDLIASDDGPYAVARRDVDKIKRWKVGLATLRRTLPAHFNTDIHEIERFNVTNARTPPCPGEIIPERWARSSRNPGRHHLGTPGRDRRNPHRTITSGKPTACRGHLRKNCATRCCAIAGTTTTSVECRRTAKSFPFPWELRGLAPQWD